MEYNIGPKKKCRDFFLNFLEINMFKEGPQYLAHRVLVRLIMIFSDVLQPSYRKTLLIRTGNVAET